MTPAEMENQVRAISGRLREISEKTPEMTGMDWASDHGWISQEEWESADKESHEGVLLQEAEVAKIEELRRKHPQAMAEFMAAHLARLKKMQHALEVGARLAKGEKAEYAMRFNNALLPEIIKALSNWQQNKPGKNWMPWAWRVAFSVTEECEAYFAKNPNPETGA